MPTIKHNYTSILNITCKISSLSRDQVGFSHNHTVVWLYEPSIVCVEVVVVIFSQSWDHPEFLVQTIIDFKSLANTLNPFIGTCPCVATGVKNCMKHRNGTTNIAIIRKIRVVNIISIAQIISKESI
jgi:hypothetical protein